MRSKKNADFEALVGRIQATSDALQQDALVVIIRNMTTRAWLTGYYIVEYEQHGADRAKYGEGLLKKLAARLNNANFALPSLKNYRAFYKVYPEVGLEVAAYLRERFGKGYTPCSLLVDAPTLALPDKSYTASGYNFRKIRFENVSLEGFADPCVEKRSEGEVEIIGGTPVRVTFRKDPNDEIYTFEKAASLLAGAPADRAAFDGWLAENAARGEVWRRAHDAWRGASDAREEGEFFRRYYGYCFNGAKGVVASKLADGEKSDVPFGAFAYALARRSPIAARAALTDFIRASPHTPAAVAGAQEALRRLLLKGGGTF